MIGICMDVRVMPNRGDEFAALVTQLQADVRKNEPGVFIFQVMRSAENPLLFAFVEVFATEAAYEAHPNMPYHQAMSQAGWACLDGPPVIRRFNALTNDHLKGARL
jgi:quinol monooxygenase YgiN